MSSPHEFFTDFTTFLKDNPAFIGSAAIISILIFLPLLLLAWFINDVAATLSIPSIKVSTTLGKGMLRGF
jgi:hypothetical protein